MFKKCFHPPVHSKGLSLVLLLLRFMMGVAFVYHGYPKIQHASSWGQGIPPFFQVLAAVSEFVGGMALVLGVVTRLAALGLVCTMAVAVSMHIFVLGDPFVNLTGGHAYELPAMYLGVALLLLVAGPGCFSLDSRFCKKGA